MIKSIFSKISSSLPISGKGGVSFLFALCFCANLSAQTAKDPFPTVDAHKYAMSMTIVCKVKMGEQIKKEEENVTIAVFQGDEIRGKDVLADYSTTKNQYPDMCMLTIYGDTNNEPLYFKVAIGGRVIEVDQGLVYTINESYGTRKAPYMIELPEPVVTNTSSEGWATTCLPFNAEIPEGVTAYAATAIEDGQLKVEPIQGTILPANTPVLVAGSAAASCEWLSRVATADKPQTNLFLGTTEKTTVEPNSVFTLGHAKNASGDIGFWKFTGTTIPANRAYLKVDNASGIKGFTWLDDADGIRKMNDGQWAMDNEASTVYDLSGRQIVNRQLPRGIYVSSGRKYVVK